MLLQPGRAYPQPDRHPPSDDQLFDQLDTLIFSGVHSRHVSLVGPQGSACVCGLGTFPYWILARSRAHAPSLYIEPWCVCGDLEPGGGEFSHKPYCILLPPGQERVLRYTVTLLQSPTDAAQP